MGFIGIGALVILAKGDRLAYIVGAIAFGVGFMVSIFIARNAPRLMERVELSTVAIVGMGLIVLKSGIMLLEAGVIGSLVGVALGGALFLREESWSAPG